MNHQELRLIAHRGWSKQFLENTIPSFAAAIAAGADEIEFDVRMSVDGVPFICHDETLDRVSNLEGPCHLANMSDLKTAGLRMLDGSILEGMGFASLDEVLRLFGKSIMMNVHIKALGNSTAALDLLAEYSSAGDSRGFYIAGDVEVLEAALSVCPHIPRCIVSTPHESIPELLDTAVRLQCERVQFFIGNGKKNDIQSALKRGLIPNYYYADKPQDAEALVDMGVIGLLTNDIGFIKRYFSDPR